MVLTPQGAALGYFLVGLSGRFQPHRTENSVSSIVTDITCRDNYITSIVTDITCRDNPGATVGVSLGAGRDFSFCHSTMLTRGQSPCVRNGKTALLREIFLQKE